MQCDVFILILINMDRELMYFLLYSSVIWRVEIGQGVWPIVFIFQNVSQIFKYNLGCSLNVFDIHM